MNDTKDLTLFITQNGAELVTDSRAVAIAFGKRHADVLRAIDKRMRSLRPAISDHYRRNFAPVEFIDQKGEARPMYRMTAKGLSELTMGFSGDDACEVRIKFLNAFEDVAQRLADRERNITEQLHDLTRREATSEVKGQIGSKLMNERKREKPGLAVERVTLESIQQPSLPLH